MNKRFVTVFAVIEILLYIIFLIFDFTDGYETTAAVLKFISIIVCMCVTFAALITLNDREKTKKGVKSNDGKICLAAGLAAGAMFFTLVSDYYLLFNDNIFPGLITFCIVQTVYLFVIIGANYKTLAICLLIRIMLAFLGTICLNGILPDEKALIITVLLYGISFLGNIIHLIMGIVFKNKENPCLFIRPAIFLAGMILFLLCDINVLLFNVGDYIAVDSTVLDTLSRAAVYLMWIFYLPAQVLIVFSNLRFEK